MPEGELHCHRLCAESRLNQRIGQVHSLVLAPAQDVATYVKYARICRKAGRRDIAFKAQAMTMNDGTNNPLDFTIVAEDEPPILTLERCRLAWAYDEKDAARDALRNLVMRLSDRLEIITKLGRKSKKVADKLAEEQSILARCLHSLGDYALGDNLVSTSQIRPARWHHGRETNQRCITQISRL